MSIYNQFSKCFHLSCKEANIDEAGIKRVQEPVRIWLQIEAQHKIIL